MSVHTKRKHPGKFNPFDLLKDSDYPYKHHNNPQPQSSENLGSVLPQTPDYSGSFLPQIDLSDHVQIVERLTIVQMLLNDIKKLSKMERTCLLSAIVNLP